MTYLHITQQFRYRAQGQKRYRRPRSCNNLKMLGRRRTTICSMLYCINFKQQSH